MKFVTKRICDILFSTILLTIFSPLLILIYFIVKLETRGPGFFIQKRVGKNGEEFELIKFRSMKITDSNNDMGLFSSKNDSRVTRFGYILRRLSLDELPQLFNVLIGDMSIVGPRPSVKGELADYEDLNEKYKKRFSVKPGITGWAQVNGRNLLNWENKIILDNIYIDKFNRLGIILDFYIIIKTFLVLLHTKNVYEISDSSKLSKIEIDRMNQEIIYKSSIKENKNGK